MRLTLTAAALAAAPAAASAAELSVSLEIPRLTVAEYHRPYVALWLETPDQTAVKTLAVWYDVKEPDQKGETWLKDIRTWWRKAGRSLDLPMDGVSGATRAPGKHQLTVSAAQLAGLAPGSYALVVEAAREVGGREVVRVPFDLPAKGAKTASAQNLSGKGSTELGAVSLTVK